MKLNFSQGIVKHAYLTAGQPSSGQDFLVIQIGNDQVNLNAPLDQPFQVAYAHYDTNYLVTIQENLVAGVEAWGYGSVAEYNQAFTIGGGSGDNSDEFYLWLDINRASGDVTYGWTAWAPTAGPTPPNAANAANRKDNQHWYDTTLRTMKVWNANGIGPAFGSWTEVVRVFAGQYTLGSLTFTSLSINAPSFLGTQAGIVGTFNAGSLIFDSVIPNAGMGTDRGNPLIRTTSFNQTVFFTTEDVFSTGLPTTASSRYETFLVEAIGQTPQAAYEMVRFSDFNEVVPLDASQQFNSVWGLIEFAIPSSGDLTQVTLSGSVRNAAWNWDFVGQQVFVGGSHTSPATTGALVTAENGYVPLPQQLPVGVAIGSDELLLRRPELALSPTVGGVTDHGNLTGLADDDHTQYHNDTRGDARYYLETELDDDGVATGSPLNVGSVPVGAKVDKVAGEVGNSVKIDATGNLVDSGFQPGSGGGVTDHGALTGLGDDDHTQYHNDARGDARYYTETELDAPATGSPLIAPTGAKVDKVDGTPGNTVEIDASGNLVDSGFQPGSGGAIELNDLTDVTITGSPVPTDDLLVFDGAQWTNSDMCTELEKVSIGCLSDVDPADEINDGPPSDGYLLSWLGSLGGHFEVLSACDWGNSNLPIGCLSDVDPSATDSFTLGEILVQFGTGFSEWRPETPCTWASTYLEIGCLSDTDIVDTSPNDILQFNGSDWENRSLCSSLSTASVSISCLGDVNTSGKATNDILVYQGGPGEWQPSAFEIVNDTTPQLGGNLDANTFTITGLPLVPTVDSEAVSKAYADSIAAGLDPKESVRVATGAGSPADIGASYSAVGGSPVASGQFTGAPTDVDGVTLVDGDRVLVKSQSDPKQNGIYVVGSTTTTWTRAPDQDGTPAAEVSGGNFTFVEAGGTYAGTGWVVIWDGNVTLNTDPVNWTQFSGGAGAITPAGADTEIQFNNSGVLGASADLTWDDTTLTVGIGGSPETDAIVANGNIVMNSQMKGGDQDVNAPTYSFQGETNSGWYRPDVSTVGLAIQGEEAIRVVKPGGSPGAMDGSPSMFPADLGIDFYLKNDGNGNATLRVETDAITFDSSLELITTLGSWKISNDTASGSGDLLFNTTTGGVLRVGDDFGSPGYEAFVVGDNDIPNKKYVDDEIAVAPFVPFLAPGIAHISPIPAAAIAASLGVGLALEPPGSMAFIIDDATGPSPFILAYVTVIPGSPGGPTWVRSDTLFPIT